MFRPRFVRESRRIDLNTMDFQSFTSIRVDAGAEIAEQRREGRCGRLSSVVPPAVPAR